MDATAITELNGIGEILVVVIVFVVDTIAVEEEMVFDDVEELV